MYDALLLPVDAGSESTRMVAHGLELAAAFDAAVDVLHVGDPRQDGPPSVPDGAGQSPTASGRDTASAVAATAEDRGLEATWDVRGGVAHEAILDRAEETPVDLIVVGTRTRETSPFLGSTAARVVATSDRPVLAVPLTEAHLEGVETGLRLYDEIVVATDGSDAAERSAAAALSIAERFGASMHVLYVVDRGTYEYDDSERSVVGMLEEGGQQAVEEIAARAEAVNVPITTTILKGRPFERIVHYTEEVDADLVSMGVRGRTGLQRPLLGSTTERVLGRTGTPVLTVD